MPRTISAADHLSRSASAPGFRREVAGLLQALAVLATYAAAGPVLAFAATAWRRRRPASCAPQRAALAAGATAASLAS